MSVDNAGTGTGRFDFLREVNADILKIDGSLVNGATDDIVSRALINGLVHMADTLGMQHRRGPGGYHGEAAGGHPVGRGLRTGVSRAQSRSTSTRSSSSIAAFSARREASARA